MARLWDSIALVEILAMSVVSSRHLSRSSGRETPLPGEQWIQTNRSRAVPSELNDTPPEVKVVFLTHYIPLYQVRVLQEVTQRLSDFRVLLSTPIEPNRDFRPDWAGLRVDVQRTITLRRNWRHAAAGFRDPLYVHVPYDTLSQLRRLRPDVVVSHELGARSVAAAAYCRRTGTPLVLATFMSEHTERGRGRLRHWLRRRLVRAADAITYNGTSCRRVLENLGADPKKLHPWSYAADDRCFSSHSELPPKVEAAVRGRLLCVGQLTQRKGVTRLVEQLRRYCQTHSVDIRLTLVGDGPQRGDLEQTAAELDSTQDRLRLTVLGNQPADALPQLMLDHSLVIAPTLADEWLLVVNEAMHQGMPVIGSIYSQAVTTLIEDGENGWRYDPLADPTSSKSGPSPAEAASLEESLRQYFAASDGQLAEMRRRARATVSPLTPQRSATELCAAVKAVVPSRAGAAGDSEATSGWIRR